MLRRKLCLFLLLLTSLSSMANNLKLGNSVKIISVTSNEVTFEVQTSWSNSWRDGYNNDAAWVFFKYRTEGGDWTHLLLNGKTELSDGYSAMTGKSAGEPTGLMIYRFAQGNGNAATVCRITWDFTGVGLTQELFQMNKVFLMAHGVEMVYVPYGPFELGDGVSEGSFIGVKSEKLKVKSDGAAEPRIEQPAAVSSKSGSMEFNTSGGSLVTGDGSETPIELNTLDGGEPVSLNGQFPTGYAGFYVMKYEVSQEQYVAFVNTLSRDEQLSLLSQLSTLKKGQYIFGSPGSPSRRNGIMVSVPMSDSRSAVLDCNLHNDDKFGAEDDGRTLACNYMSPNDMLSYTAWAGLRPMAETEYEKACRRLLPQTAVPEEYAWGSIQLTSMAGVVPGSEGWNTESPNSGWVNAEGRFGTYPGTGPVRSGAFASVAVNRKEAGGTFCGVMELSGNVAELCINATKSSAFTFSGMTHGTGACTTEEWGRMLPAHMGLRGGSFASNKERLRVSDRHDASGSYFSDLSQRDSTVGFRGVRMLDASDLDFRPGTITINGGAATVCSGIPFTLIGSEAIASGVSGLVMHYQWYQDNVAIPYETGQSLTLHTGIFNKESSDKQFTFARSARCAVGELMTEPFVVTVPGKLSITLPQDVDALKLSCNATSVVTGSRTSNSRFRWINGSSGAVVQDWSAPATSSAYTPLHKDFGYMAALRKVRCVSDANGCLDSTEINLFIEASCFLTVTPSDISMSTNANGGTVTATLCGPGTVKWYYRDNSGNESLIASGTAIISSEKLKVKSEQLNTSSGSSTPSGSSIYAPAGSAAAGGYFCSYTPKYSDFKNTIGDRTVVVYSSLGSDARCMDKTEFIVHVSATLSPGAISGPALACGGSSITVTNTKDAGVEGMEGLKPIYSWFVDGATTPLVGETKSTLTYTLPANTANRAVSHTFTRKAVTAAPALQSAASNTYTVSVPGVPTVTVPTPQAVCNNTNLVYPNPVIDWAGLEGTGTWTLNGGAVPSPVLYANNGQLLVYTVKNTCNSPVASAGVPITVYKTTVITTHPSAQTLCQTGTISLSIGATGHNLSYQWQKNNGNIGTGATYSKAGAVPADGGSYRCIVSGTCGAPTSNTVTVTVNPSTVITSNPSNAALCSGQSATFSVSASGTAPLSYRWNNGNTSSSFSTTTGGTYYCTVTGGCGSINSGSATFTVRPLPSGSISGGGSVCPGGTATVYLSFAGGSAPYTYSVGDGNRTSNSTSASVVKGRGTYYLTALSDGYGCVASSRTGSATVTETTPTVASAGSVYANPAEVCTSAAFTLQNSADGYGTCSYPVTKYEWYRSDGTYVGASASLSLSGYGNGTYSFYRKAYLSNGQSANTGNVSVTVKSCGPPPWDQAGWSMSDVCTNCTWQQAVDKCASLGMRLPNNDDWGRLPKSSNVLGLSDFGYCWSATEYSGNASYWYWATTNGNLYGPYSNNKTYLFRVRCVRN